MNWRQAPTRCRSPHWAGRMPQSPSSRMLRAGHGGHHWRVGGHDGLGARLGQVVQQRDQPEARGERQRGVGLVHEVEARLADPGAQDLQEALAVAELVEPLGTPAGVVLQVGVQAVHGVGAQEVRPARPEQPALDFQVPADAGLAVPGPEQGLGRPALGVEPARLGQHLHDRGLARAVLAHQDRHAAGQLQALGQDLLHGRDGGGPAGGVDNGVGTRPDRADHAGVGLPP